MSYSILHVKYRRDYTTGCRRSSVFELLAVDGGLDRLAGGAEGGEYIVGSIANNFCRVPAELSNAKTTKIPSDANPV
jgi:hypothetical protein